MKRYKNVSNRHLQFFYAKVELAPGQEASVADGAAKDDPGFQNCIDLGYLEEVSTRRTRQTATKPKQAAKKQESSKPEADLLDQVEPKDKAPITDEKQES